MIKRPLLRYHGGKFILAKWIISHFPEHRVYVEPFGGAASVLLQKQRAYAEIYNDLDNEVVNLFKVCREHGQYLIGMLKYTPYSKTEFNNAYDLNCSEIELARRTIIRSFMGFGSGISSKNKTGFRANSNRSGTTPAHDWVNYPDNLNNIIDRLRGVTIECKDYKIVVAQHDGKETLIYWDPPYVLETRFKGAKTDVYKHEFTNDNHIEMIDTALSLEAMNIISGYDNQMYNDMLTGWQKVEKIAMADGAKKAKECLWISPNAFKNKTLF